MPTSDNEGTSKTLRQLNSPTNRALRDEQFIWLVTHHQHIDRSISHRSGNQEALAVWGNRIGVESAQRAACLFDSRTAGYAAHLMNLRLRFSYVSAMTNTSRASANSRADGVMMVFLPTIIFELA